MNAADTLAGRLKSGPMVVAPGAYDCITARLVAQAGFGAVYMTGAGTAATLGFPDYGLVSMNEMTDNAGRIADAVGGIPVIADADTAFGNELNATRTVREYEKNGVAAIHIEDQEFPKRCGHLDNKVIIPLEDYVAKIRAAVAARQNPNFTIIARTDSRAGMGLDEAVRRCNAALEAGAGMAFLEAPQSVEEIAAIPKLVKGPCLLNLAWAGKTPQVDLAEADRMGYRLAILPGILMAAVISRCDEVLADLRESGRHPQLDAKMSPGEMFRRMGSADWDPLRDQFRTPTPRAAAE
ncbi:isocitrate lyase/PEP mutase family protein [Enterovirga sp. CN4-39]|uniref:isocitrate lyase/PEP mutase family protein n=1 Tax=Enterovirga sp. CN4-39 TaxID=3400910 RepID=UPI003C0D1D6E